MAVPTYLTPMMVVEVLAVCDASWLDELHVGGDAKQICGCTNMEPLRIFRQFTET